MTVTVGVMLTADQIDELSDAIADQIRHWEECGGDAEETERYTRTIAGLKAITLKLDKARTIF